MICPCCGEPIPGGLRVCPYCEEAVFAVAAEEVAPPPAPKRPAPLLRRAPPVRGAGSGSGIRSVNVDDDRPTIDEALKRLRAAVERAHRDRIGLLRVVHGHGTSGGPSPTIRHAVRARLHALQRNGEIRLFLYGEDFSPATDAASRALLRRHPALASTLPADRRNPGITFVEP
jgi:hypothetical protein